MRCQRPLSCRGMDLHRIVAEYAVDAIAALGAPTSSFTDADRHWVCRNAATSYDEIEQATLRLVAVVSVLILDMCLRRLR